MLSEFTPLHPTVPIAFLNDRFEQPRGSAWVQMAVIDGVSQRVELGRPYPRWQYGVINVTCMVPEGTGTALAKQLADSVLKVFADRQRPVAAIGGGVTTYGAEKKHRGVINGWFTVNVLVDWRAFVANA